MDSATATAVNDAPASAAPTSFAEAFASDASPAPESSQQSNDATAAVQPATDGEATPQQSDDPRSPFIPRTRFDEVNTKLNELKTWREQRAWAEQVDQSTFQQMASWFQRAHTSPIEFATEFLAELQQHPTHGQQLRSLVARTLANGRGQQHADDAMPDADVAITDANGNVVSKTYSADQLAKRDAWLTRQLMAQVEQKYAPMAKTVADVKAEREALQAQSQAKQFAGGFFTELSALPGFADHKQAIAQEIQRANLQSDNPAEVKAAAYQAYLKVVLPTLGAKAQSQLLDNLQQKAAASTSVNPGSAAPSTPKTITSFHQLGADAWK